MRRIALLHLILAIFFSPLIWAQHTASFVKEAKINYQKITENLANYSNKTVPLLENSAEGATITGYYQHSHLKMMSASWFSETGKKSTEFYIEQGKLFFVLEKTYTYNRPIYWDATKAKNNGDDEVFDLKKSKITENRVYFKDSKIVLWLNENQHKVEVSKQVFAAKEKELTTQNSRLQKRLKKQKNAD
ncbi:hypothetical protein [Zunongwangia sp. HGR-M22]|uniref:hypothetical protein n=1 Tax=Zunongwangia sp. HGR-M22 TaxID=3015168 RepID=UPI0022DE7C76|nr:hypothetical protein [Zunongwangia sp. HGR-M22]WBL27008.1 hypothetical protein PBT91_06990 [Zunongwangia sp. HGR-M22]